MLKLYFEFRLGTSILFYSNLYDPSIPEKAPIKIILYLCISVLFHLFFITLLYFTIFLNNFLVISSRYFNCLFILLVFSFMDLSRFLEAQSLDQTLTVF